MQMLSVHACDTPLGTAASPFYKCLQQFLPGERDRNGHKSPEPVSLASLKSILRRYRSRNAGPLEAGFQQQ